MAGAGWRFRLKRRRESRVTPRASAKRLSRLREGAVTERRAVPERIRIHIFSWHEEYVSIVAAKVREDSLAVHITGAEELLRLMNTLLELRTEPAFAAFLWSPDAGLELVTWGESSDWLAARSVGHVLVRYPHWLRIRHGHLYGAETKQA